MKPLSNKVNLPLFVITVEFIGLYFDIHIIIMTVVASLNRVICPIFVSIGILVLVLPEIIYSIRFDYVLEGEISQRKRILWG